MISYIYKVQTNYIINDLRYTIKNLFDIFYLLKLALKKNKKILFVSSELKFSRLTKKIAKKLNFYYIIDKWVNGTLTNWKNIQIHNKNYNIKNSSKKISNKIKKRKKYFLGIKHMLTLPNIIITFGSPKKIFVREAEKLNIPIISLYSRQKKINNDINNLYIPYNLTLTIHLQFIFYLLNKFFENHLNY